LAECLNINFCIFVNSVEKNSEEDNYFDTFDVNVFKELARKYPQLLHLPSVNLSTLLGISLLHFGHLIFNGTSIEKNFIFV